MDQTSKIAPKPEAGVQPPYQRYGQPYQGHIIFRNQPPHSWFDQDLDEDFDMLYCCLNEINPYFLENDEELNDDAFTCTALVDPRTNSVIEHTFIDHTLRFKPPIFDFNSLSELTPKEHRIMLGAIQKFQRKEDIGCHLLEVLNDTEHTLLKERTKFMEFLLHYCHINHEKIYSPARIFVELYKRFYQKKVNLIKKYLEDAIFISQTGLPNPKCCAVGEIFGEISNAKIVDKSGAVAIWSCQCNLKNIRPRIDKFLEIYLDSMENNSPKTVNVPAQFVIPSETLLFLMCTGEYVDVPTETMITVRVEEEEKIIEFQNPLPSRSPGLHSNLFIVESAIQAYISFPDVSTWLHFDDKNFSSLKKTQCKEIDGSEKGDISYKVYTHDDYMENIPLKNYRTFSNVYSNSFTASWKLKWFSEKEQHEFDILTTSSFPTAVNVEGDTIMHGHTVKLEYKSEFGCEYATKMELLRDWILLKLYNSMNEITRHRIDVTTFTEQKQEIVTLEEIELQLSKEHSMSVSKIMGGIGAFLELLLKVPVGNYMLRYMPKYKDKLMLCAPTKEVIRTSVSLYALLNEAPTDLAFTMSPTILPISDKICSVMHEFYQVLPCTFPPKTKTNMSLYYRNGKGLQIINDKRYIMNKVRSKAQQQEEIKKIKEAKHKARKRLKRKRETKRKNIVKKQEKSELKIIQNEIEVDKLHYGFKEE